MAEFSLSKTFDVPADRLWAFASDPDNLVSWLPTAQRSSPTEGDRVQLAGDSHGHHYDLAASLHVDDGARRLSWSVADAPGYEGWLEISGEDSHGELTVHLSLSDESPAAAQSEEVERGMAEALDGLADAARL